MALIKVPQNQSAADNRREFYTENESFSVGGSPLTGFNNTYYAERNEVIEISAEIVDSSGNLQSQLDNSSLGFPPDYILKMPVTKFINGINGDTVDEIYFNVVFSGGTMTATGAISASGDWKLVSERVNKALAVIGTDFKIVRDNITILV